MRPRLVLGLAAIGIVAISGLTIVHFKFNRLALEEGSQSELFKNAKASAGTPSRSIASVNRAAAQISGAAPVPNPLSVSENSSKTKADLSFFYETMLKDPQVADYYLKLKEKLPNTKTGELISVYISEAIARQNTADFFAFMMNLQAAINEDPHEMAAALLDNRAILQSGPLTYQLSLNLAQTLNIAPEEKAQILGQALAMNMQFDENGQVDPMSSNVLTAFILMKNAGITSQQALPFILKGVDANQGNSAALSAYLDRARAYYPDAI